MRGGVLDVAKSLAKLSAEEYKLAISFAKELKGPEDALAPPRKKRKYIRKAAKVAKAVEELGEKSLAAKRSKKRASSGEIDHSPRPVEEQ